jgi:nucleoside-diphosphate-sugar epimerase
MQVFIAGPTGVLGRRLVALCSERGHDVIGLTRDTAGDELVRESGGEPHRGDVLDRDSVVEATSGADVLVHAATKIPTDTNPDEEDWALNDRVRKAGAENLVAAAAEHDADRVVLQSVVWVARQPDGSHFDEESEPHPDRSTRSALDAERILHDGADSHGYEPVVLRGGYFYAADTAHTKLFGERLLDRRLPIIAGGLLGRDDAALSFVHVDDAASAFAAAVDGDATGTFHVVDDDPTTYAEFLQRFAERLDAPSPRRVPGWLAAVAIDDNTRRLLTRPMPTSNDRFRQAFDWAPEHPTVEQGLDQVVSEWEQAGEVLDRVS